MTVERSCSSRTEPRHRRAVCASRSSTGRPRRLLGSSSWPGNSNTTRSRPMARSCTSSSTSPGRRTGTTRSARSTPPPGSCATGAVADKNEGDEAMAGWPIAQVRRPDGMVFTLYHGAEHPFIHALSSVDAWALCIDLPATGRRRSDGGLRLGADGDHRRTLDHRRERDTRPGGRHQAVRISRSAGARPSRHRRRASSRWPSSATMREARSVAASSPLRRGSVIYAAGAGGIVSIATSDLSLTGRFLEGVPVDALAVTVDGGTIYALHPCRRSDRQARRRFGQDRRRGPGQRLRPTRSRRSLVSRGFSEGSQPVLRDNGHRPGSTGPRGSRLPERRAP